MNLGSIKPQTNLITQHQLDILKSEGAQIFTPKAIDTFRLKVLLEAKNNPKEKHSILEKAQKELSELFTIEVIKDNGSTEEFMIKGLKFPNKDQKEKGNDGVESNDSTEEDNSIENNSEIKDDTAPSTSTTDNKDESSNSEKEESNETENSIEITDEEKEILQFISDSLSNGESTDQQEISEGENYPDDKTKEILNSLKEKELIECNIDDNGNLDVIAITDLGKSLLGNSDSFEETKDDSLNNNKDNQEGDNSNQNNDGNQEDTQKDNKENNIDSQNQNYSDDELASHAKSTDSAKLQEFLSNPNVDTKLKAIAQKELDSRNGGDLAQNNDENNSEVDSQNQEQENNDGGQDEEQDFKKWIDSHFSEHDEEDLAKLVKDLINQSPGKRKELKEKFKADFSKNNGGNSVTKVDDKEFGEWLDQYLSHLPFNDLKDYANKLVSKNPEAFNSMKKKYKMFKDNNMLDS